MAAPGAAVTEHKLLMGFGWTETGERGEKKYRFEERSGHRDGGKAF